MLTRLRATAAALAISGTLLVPVAAATDAAAASCVHHTTGSCAANSKHPSGAMAKCKDNTYSYSKHPEGTCSRHKGVKDWYK